MRKPLVCHPGASFSVHDTFVGLVEAWRASGQPLAEFQLDGRIQYTHGYLHYQWRQMRRTHPETAWPKPTPADVLLQACSGLVERALWRECDGILVVTGMFLQPDMLTLARRAGLQAYLLCTESPYDLAHELKVAALADGVWTTERTAVEAFAAVCPHAAYLPHAYRSGVHDQPASPADAHLRAHDVVFVGSYFPERIALLEAVDWTGIDLGLYGTTYVIKKTSPLARFVVAQEVPNAQATGLYRRAKIGLNLYRTTPPGCAAPESLNPRAYELAAAGVCQVSPARAETAERFDGAVRTFDSAATLEAVVHELLADDDQRAQLASEAQRLVAPHTWQSRILQMRRDLNAWEASASRFSRSA